MKNNILLLLTALLWSLGGPLIKAIDLTPLTIAGTRAIIAFVVLAIYFRKIGPLKVTKIEFFGSIAYSAVVIFFVLATKLTTAGAAILLQYTAPIYVAIMSHFFLNEKIRPLDFVTMTFVIGGMILFFIEDLSSSAFNGNIFGLLSGIAFATMIVFMRKAKDGHPIKMVILGNLITAFICLPMSIGEVSQVFSFIPLILILAVFQMAIPYILYTEACKNTTALSAILIISIEPILNPLWVFFLIGEKLSSWAVVGGGLVFFAILWNNVHSYFESRKKLLVSNSPT